MQISDLLLVLRRYWWPLILLPVIAVSAAYALRPAKSYAASESLQVLPAGPVTNISSQGVQYLIPPVVARLQTQQFSKEVSLQLPRNDANAPVKIGVNGDTATGLLTITATSTDAGAVAPWANAYGNYLVSNPGSVSGLASITVIENAVQPVAAQHSSLKAELVGAALLGLLVGLLAALGYGYYRAQQADPSHIKSRLGAAVLVNLPTVRRRRLGRWSGSSLVSSPAIHELNMRLELVQVERWSSDRKGGRRSIAILSEKRRVGRSEIANALAWEICQSGSRVAIVHADLGGTSPVDPRAGHVPGRVRGSRTGRQWPTPYFLDDEENPSEAILSSLPALLKAIEPLYDVVIIDAPPLKEGADGAVVAVLAGAALWVTERRPDRNLLRRRITELSSSGVDVLGIVFNRPPGMVHRILHPRTSQTWNPVADETEQPAAGQSDAPGLDPSPPSPSSGRAGEAAVSGSAGASTLAPSGRTPARPPGGPGRSARRG